MVVDSSLPPKALEHISLTQGTREAPPQISTESMDATARPHEAFALSSTSFTFCIMGLHISRKISRSMLLPKSWSSIMHSQETLASELEERTFFVFPTASSSLKRALLLDSTSQPVFFWNCSAKARIRHSSMSRPPTFSDFSHRTVSFPLTNCTIATENTVWPIWQKATVVCLTGSKLLERKKPYSNATAVCSFMILSTLRPAILEASSRAILWKSVKYEGTPITTSATVPTHHASVISLSFVSNIAVIAVAENVASSPL
mmetsp:Transcript_58464/g.153953  ORF Transcript_58464/g.153953 Transcript_58464/m.153953 type:complete len:260 (-) Transcript_58464:283-1062(-)